MKYFSLLVAIIIVFLGLAFEATAVPNVWRRAEAGLLVKRENHKHKIHHGDDLVRRRGPHSNNTNAQITYYQGHDLLNSACYGTNGLPVYNANPMDMIAAMSFEGFDRCYQCLEIMEPTSKKTVVVKVIDKCAGCPVNGPNVDLTTHAFQALAALAQGRINIMWRALPACPTNGSWPKYEMHGHK